mmetsp:Transcript_91367/g.258075  ORF Transcript_91367/g.258075 Transcript_91367/m.258075 type:complete len:233 (+) Transcript_91367:1028-1726(+)
MRQATRLLQLRSQRFCSCGTLRSLGQTLRSLEWRLPSMPLSDRTQRRVPPVRPARATTRRTAKRPLQRPLLPSWESGRRRKMTRRWPQPRPWRRLQQRVLLRWFPNLRRKAIKSTKGATAAVQKRPPKTQVAMRRMERRAWWLVPRSHSRRLVPCKAAAMAAREPAQLPVLRRLPRLTTAPQLLRLRTQPLGMLRRRRRRERLPFRSPTRSPRVLQRSRAAPPRSRAPTRRR